MKRILHTVLMLLVAVAMFAQSYPRKVTEEDIPASERNKYFEQVENNIHNFYMLLLDLSDQEMREEFISEIFMDNSNRHIPEFYLLDKKDQRLSPGQYLIELDKAISSFDRDRLDFQIENISHQPDMFMMNMRSCYVHSEYDLTLKDNGKVVFKRRCRITSFFPKASSYIRVKTMQVEPVRDIIAYKKPVTQTVVADNNQTTKKVKVSGVITENSSLDDNVIITGNTQNVNNKQLNFDFIGAYSDWGAVCRINDKYGFIDKDKNILVPAIYDAVGCDYLAKGQSGNEKTYWGLQKMMSVSRNGKWGFVDKTGKEVIPCIYDKVKTTINEKSRPVWVMKDGLYGCVDTLGNKVIDMKYRTEIYFYNNNTPAIVQSAKNLKWGAINSDGKVAVDFIYDEVGSFENGLAAVLKDDKVGFINNMGLIVIPCKYEAGKFNGKYHIPSGCNFRGNCAAVKLNGKYALINSKGVRLTSFKYDLIQIDKGSDGYKVTCNGLDIYLDRRGNEYSSQKEQDEKSDSIMAIQGDCQAQLELGIKYYKKKNYNTSLNWLKKAYTQDEPEASFYMAQCYYYNKPANYDAAKLFYQDAISKHSHVIESFYSLAWMAEHGQGQDEDIEEAISLYEKCGSYHDAKNRMEKLVSSYNNSYEYVDLGLSVKWATCNLGASSPEESGDKFAWGETNRKNYFEKNNSRNYKKKFGLSINGTYLDAARTNMGGKWQMPTVTQFKELIDKCKWEETYYKGTKGYTITGPNGNHIFLPNKNYTGYWLANPDKSKKTAFRAFISKTLKTILSSERYNGFYIRAVIE